LRAGPGPITVLPVLFDDKAINAAARRVLTSLWVDITQVLVSTTRGNVRISGHLERMTASQSEFHEAALTEMDRRVRAVSGVRSVQYALDNWQQTMQGRWLPRGGRTLPPAGAPPSAYEIKG
jgi:hypothetical protein